jgi:hypothetical protein
VPDLPGQRMQFDQPVDRELPAFEHGPCSYGDSKV